MASNEEFRQIAQEAKQRFDERLKNAESDAVSLGWDSEESMETRFNTATEMYDFSDAKVLDVGCGFGDFYGFLKEKGQKPAEYYGLDISEKILDIAQERYPPATFEKRNIFIDQFEDRTFDVGVEFGILNYNLEIISNEKYVREYMQKTYEICDTVLVNCLSDYREGEWEREEFVHYYSPEKVFGYAQELSRDVVLKHDFEPIPQKEFNLLLK